MLLVSVKASGQISVQYLTERKPVCLVGDTVKLSVRINVPPETCLDGMKGTKFYQSGISIVKQSAWKEIGKGFWQREITLIITGNKKKTATLTILRRNDKQSLSYQEQFNYELQIKNYNE
jgi:hypothetical protein